MIIRNIQALRGLAANAVLISHLLIVESKYSYTPLLPDRARFGAFGVDLFFVISGFIMVTIASNGAWAPFLVGRIRRILPPYWFYTTLVLLVSFYVPSAVNSSFAHPASLWRSYLLIPDRVDPLLAVGWTLIHEMYFYLCFAFMLALTRVLALPALLGMWALAVLCLHGVLRLYEIDSPVATVVAHPLTLEFIAGAVIGILIKRKIMGLAASALVAGSIALLLVLWFRHTAMALMADPSWMRVLLVGSPCALIVYGVVAMEHRGTLKASRWLVELGDASYSTYLSHVLVLSALGHLFALMTDHNAAREAGFIIACIVAGNAVGVASCRLIERRRSPRAPHQPTSREMTKEARAG